MKLKTILVSAAAVLLCVFAGIAIGSVTAKKSYMPVFKVTGDVSEPYSVKTIKDMKSVQIDLRGKKEKAFYLKDVVEKSKPYGKGSILIAGDDGLTAEVPYGDLDESYIAQTAENGWEAVNFKHPVSSNIKRIKEIVVVADKPPKELSVNIISADKDIMQITPGMLYLMDSKLYPRFEGKSSVENGQKQNSVSIYTMHRLVKLKDIANINSKVLIMGDKGGYMQDDGEGYLETDGNCINYVMTDMKNGLKNIKGIMINPPEVSVMNAYDFASSALDGGSNVMMIYLDGFGYHQYQKAINEGYAPFLKSLPKAEKASTVYVPVTNAGFAAMITGKPPSENGVYSRAQRELKSPDIFKKAIDAGKKALLVEGNLKILSAGVEPDLNADANKNSYCDDEIYKDAIDKLGQGNNLMMVHFHSIDDAGHKYGDFDQRTMKVIQTVDGYVKDIMSSWKGKVVITADHGMHSVNNAGGHGVFTYTDMVVPFIQK